MPLSDISRKAARSDVLSRLDQVESGKLDPGEINLWLEKAVFEFFNRMGILADKWYGTSQAISVTAPAGAITAIPLTGAYGLEKIAKINKWILADGSTVIKEFEYKKLEYMLGNSNYEETYGYAWNGPNLYILVGAAATALSTEATTFYFTRKPDEMGGDNNVHTVTFASAVEDDTIDVNGVRMTARDAATSEFADFITTGTDEAAGDNFEDVLENLFQSVTGVTASSTTGTVTITGAKRVTSSNATRLAVAATVASMVDVPTEYVDLVVMGAQARALGKMQMTEKKTTVENQLAQRYGEIHQLYGQAIQVMNLESQAGVQTPRGE